MTVRGEVPRTVLPPSRDATRAAGIGAGIYERASAPVLSFADEIGVARVKDTGAILREAADLLDGFTEALRRLGAIPSTLPPARYALALILDQKARANRKIDAQSWNAGATRHLFDGRDVSAATLRDFIRKAEAAGPDYAAVKAFLEFCLRRLDDARLRLDTDTGPNWTGIVTVLVFGFLFAVAAWTAHVEWKFHHRLSDAFDAEVAETGLLGDAEVADLGAGLDALRAAVDRVAVQERQAPIHFAAGWLGFDAGTHAEATYQAVLSHRLPAAIGRAIDDAIASEGEPVPLYDSVRAWSVLSGGADWSPAYLSGWLTDRGAVDPKLLRLAPHALRLSRPVTPPPPPDAELLAQATSFASEAPEAERAFLELRRSDAATAIPPWNPQTLIPELPQVMMRRSGRPIDAGVPGLFTAAGWDYARDIGAGVAVQKARAVAARLFGKSIATQNDAPDKVMATLQRQTLARWSAYLADLRVRPFLNDNSAVLISGQLALRESPLVKLLKEVWKQAGGTDRRRPHDLQLTIAAEFGPMIQYVEQGRMADISNLFASLNVALGSMDHNAAAGMQRLMSIEDRAQSITALRQAPVVVVQIVEDVLAQTAASHSDMLTNPLTRAWQAEALSTCKASVDGLFPFAADGPDADIGAVTHLLQPGGTLDRFYTGRAETYLDTSSNPWRWKPEARFQGLSQDSAAFFERAHELTDALFKNGAAGADMTLAALAEKGQAFIQIGGQGGPVTTDDAGLRVNWPGADPAKGAEVSFQSTDGNARLTQPGSWGLFRILEPFRLRERDGGKRFVIDLHADTARLFLEVTFDQAENPLSARKLLRDLHCPPVL